MKRLGCITAVIIQIMILTGINKTYTQSVTTIEIPEGKTLYPLQSNSSSHMLEQNPVNPAEMHAVFMVSTDPPPNFADRNGRYFYSTNSGSNWGYAGTVTTNRSGFPSLDITNDGRAVIAAHSTDGGGINRLQLYVDLAPGVGSWTRLDPGANGNGSFGPIWPVIAVNRENNHVVFAGSQNGIDSAFVNICTSLTGSGTFVGYRPIPNGETAGQYAAAAGTGIIGVAFNTLDGGAAYMSSTNNGTTWSTPTVIWTWNPADSIGTLRSIDLRYEGSTPQVVLGLCQVDPIGGGFYPGNPAKIMFWSPNINGGNPVKIDSAGGLTGIVNDVYLSVCRPVLGSASGNLLYAAYCRARLDTLIEGNHYFDVYLSCSQNGGASWSTPYRVTNRTGPLSDCRYPSISNWNGFYNGVQAVNLLYQSDSLPVSSSANGLGDWVKMMYARVTGLSCIPIGIINSGSEIPLSFTLRQNYPNPFNPATQIEFALPKQSRVKIVIYNSIGEAVDVILNQNLSAGSYKADWDASRFASGVYFYELQTADFIQSKKMVLLK